MAQFSRSAAEPSHTAADQGNLHHVPKPLRATTMMLADLVGAAEIAAIKNKGEIRFHATGDAGAGANSQQDLVAQAMAREIQVENPQDGPVFFLNLGDIIYGNDKVNLYPNRFYRPNKDYLKRDPNFEGIILAIPGNHDGETTDDRDKPSLKAFLENFCSDPDSPPALAKTFGVKMPSQPGPYWRLDAPFLDLIGLYSNSGEDLGLLGKNAEDNHQPLWLATELKKIATARDAGDRKALLLAVHHPPYNRGLRDTGLGHPSSTEMQAQIDAACAEAEIWPDAVLSGHSHNYQRYIRSCRTTGGRKFVTYYFVAGTGGIKASPAPESSGDQAQHKTEVPPPPGLAESQVLYINGMQANGFLRIRATAEQLSVTFVKVEENHRHDVETVTLDLPGQVVPFNGK